MLCQKKRKLNTEKLQHAASYNGSLMMLGCHVTLQSFIFVQTAGAVSPSGFEWIEVQFIRCYWLPSHQTTTVFRSAIMRRDSLVSQIFLWIFAVGLKLYIDKTQKHEKLLPQRIEMTYSAVHRHQDIINQSLKVWRGRTVLSKDCFTSVSARVSKQDWVQSLHPLILYSLLCTEVLKCSRSGQLYHQHSDRTRSLQPTQS